MITTHGWGIRTIFVYICLFRVDFLLPSLSLPLPTYVLSSACLLTLLLYLPTFGNRHMHFSS
jgi:hypothetical protein